MKRRTGDTSVTPLPSQVIINFHLPMRRCIVTGVDMCDQMTQHKRKFRPPHKRLYPRYDGIAMAIRYIGQDRAPRSLEAIHSDDMHCFSIDVS